MITFISFVFASSAAAKCACGYTVNSTGDADYALFTDLLETDFLHIQDIAYNDTYSTGWIPQIYNTTAHEDQGPYGMAKEDCNIVPNYIENLYNSRWRCWTAIVGSEPTDRIQRG